MPSSTPQGQGPPSSPQPKNHWTKPLMWSIFLQWCLCTSVSVCAFVCESVRNIDFYSWSLSEGADSWVRQHAEWENCNNAWPFLLIMLPSSGGKKRDVCHFLPCSLLLCQLLPNLFFFYFFGLCSIRLLLSVKCNCHQHIHVVGEHLLLSGGEQY